MGAAAEVFPAHTTRMHQRESGLELPVLQTFPIPESLRPDAANEWVGWELWGVGFW